jgi:ABC-2 type transport system ATP-binding protein
MAVASQPTGRAVSGSRDGNGSRDASDSRDVGGAILKVSGLRARYGPRVVLEDISLTLGAGDWFVLLGPNGCGKSTLLDCVVDRLKPARGEICISGHSLAKDPYEAKLQLGYGCAPEALPPLLTSRQCLEVHAGAKGLATIGNDVLELGEELRFTPFLESFVDTLSLGTRQKLTVLLALVGDPLLIVLDEAFNGLDPASSLALKRHLRARLLRRGGALLLATHSLDILEHYADRAAVLIDGRLKHEWKSAELERLRASCADFEAALAQAIAAGTPQYQSPIPPRP